MALLIEGYVTFTDDTTLAFNLVGDSKQIDMVIPAEDWTIPVDTNKQREQHLIAVHYWANILEEKIGHKTVKSMHTTNYVNGAPQNTRTHNFNVNVPSRVRMGMTYASALYKWNKAGKPERGADEVADIFSSKCQPCRYFSEMIGGGQCTLCGCLLNTSESALHNKIKMGTESCPISKW